MKRYAQIACAALLVAACGGSKTQPTPGPVAPPNTIIFTAQLSAANEVPPITNAEANARGDVTITFNLTRDAAGAITAGTATFVYNVTNLPGVAPLNLSHIHNGASGIAAGVFISTGQSAANGIATGANGSVSNVTFSNVAITAAQAQAVIDNPAGHYFNVHSQLNGGGVCRGQLVRQ
jgi:hypothetical protein